MKTEKEIKDEIERTEAEYINLAHHDDGFISPDFRFAKLHRLNALKWVLDNENINN